VTIHGQSGPVPWQAIGGRTFFTLWIVQCQAQRAVRTTPVINADTPPTEGKFRLRPTLKGQ
jgi:hypothetical protein